MKLGKASKSGLKGQKWEQEKIIDFTMHREEVK